MADAISVAESAAGESGLHRLAVVAIVCCVATVLLGAMETSSGGSQFVLLHKASGGAMSLLLMILGAFLLTSGKEALVRVGGGLLIVVLGNAGLALEASAPWAAIGHAIGAQVLLALTTSAVVVTGASWQSPPALVEDHGWPSLKSLGTITTMMVVIQITLGAGFRHKEMGVLSHLFFAMVLVLVILCLCIFVMQQFPEHKALRPAANMLMAVAFTQIFLGIAAFTVRTITNKVTWWVIGVTATHVVVGAITLAASVMMLLQIRRNVYRKREGAE